MKSVFKRGENIILIGMPAAGKSTVGVVLAKMLGYDFIDTDLLLQRRGNGTLKEIIDRQGLEGFLDLEGEVCGTLDVRNTVIATGGSAVYRHPAMEHLKESGTAVFLYVDLDTLTGRLRDLRGRGVALKDGQSLKELFEERSRLYEKYADLTVDEKDLTLEETARAVYEALT